MTDLGATIEEYLVGLAGSLQQAQQQLGRLVVPGDEARPTVSYQLPKLDFELRLSLELARESDAATTEPGRNLVLRGRPADATATTRAESASVISGSFVAVPLSGGKPPPVVSTELLEVTPNRFRITVLVASAAGEPLDGVRVQFDVDPSLASDLGTTAPLPTPEKAVAFTDPDGEAITFLEATETPAGAAIPVLIDTLGTTTTVLFRTRDSA